jgi:hypothetical protein
MSQLNRFMYQSEYRLLLSAVHNPHTQLISDTCGSHVCLIQARRGIRKHTFEIWNMKMWRELNRLGTWSSDGLGYGPLGSLNVENISTG